MNLACFSNIVSTLLIAEVIRTYLLLFAAKLLLSGRAKSISMLALSIFNIILHTALFIALLYIKAPYEELLMLYLGSSALALTVAKFRGRR